MRVQEDLVTPTIPRRSADRPTQRESLHRKSKSMPASTPTTPTAADLNKEDPVTPLSPSSDSNIDKVRPSGICLMLCTMHPKACPGARQERQQQPADNKNVETPLSPSSPCIASQEPARQHTHYTNSR